MVTLVFASKLYSIHVIRIETRIITMVIDEDEYTMGMSCIN